MQLRDGRGPVSRPGTWLAVWVLLALGAGCSSLKEGMSQAVQTTVVDPLQLAFDLAGMQVWCTAYRETTGEWPTTEEDFASFVMWASEQADGDMWLDFSSFAAVRFDPEESGCLLVTIEYREPWLQCWAKASMPIVVEPPPPGG